MTWTSLVIAVAVLAAASGCKRAASTETVASDRAMPVSAPDPVQAQPKLQTLKLWLGSEELVAELALTMDQLRTGMMYRTNMAENEAMLFVFGAPHQASFWMKNTPLPLSAAYIDPEGVILEIHDLHPRDTNTVSAATDRVQYVLETRQGWFDRHKVGRGALVRTERGSLRDTFSFRRQNP